MPKSSMSKSNALNMQVRLGPITLANPIVAASGTYGHGDEVARLGDPARLGAVTVKSLSAEPWDGNPPPRVYEATAGMINSVGLSNPGVQRWRDEELPALLARGAKVIASIWGRSVEEYAMAASDIAQAREHLLALEVNASCPNIEDRAHVFAHSADATFAVIRAAVDQAQGLPVFAKLSPNVTDLCEIATAAISAGATGLTLVNTVFGLAIDPQRRMPRLGAGGGGLSGPAIKPIALRCVADVAKALPGVPIIGTGGVACASDAVEMMLAGATAVGVGTASFRDPRAGEKIARGLARWCRRNDVNQVSELIGALRPQVGQPVGIAQQK